MKLFLSDPRVKRFQIIPDVLELVTNVNRIYPFPLVNSDFRVSRHFESTREAPVKLGFFVASSQAFPIDRGSLYRLSEEYFTDDTRHRLYYRGRLADWIPVEMALVDDNSFLTLYANRPAYTVLKFQVKDFSPPGHHLRNLAFVELLRNGYLLLHSSSVASRESGSAALLVAPSGTGKTVTVMSLLQEGFSFITEDISVVTTREVYSCPLSSTYTSSSYAMRVLQEAGALSRREWWKYRLEKLITRFPLLRAYLNLSLNPMSILHHYPSVRKAAINKLFFLHHGHGDEIRPIKNAEKNDFVKELVYLNRVEIPYMADSLLLHYGLIQPQYTLEILMDAEFKIISGLVDNAECYIVESSSPTGFPKLIRGYLR